MSFLATFDLTLATLFVALLVPFLPFAVRYRYYYNPDLIRRLSFSILLLAASLGILIALKLVNSAHSLSQLDSALAGLHFLPLVLTGLIIHFGGGIRRSVAAPLPGQEVDATSYRPIPLNSEIERWGWDALVIEPNVRQELETVIRLLKDPATAARYGIEAPKGILLNGPPGTGKTTIAKVMASTAGMAFFVLRIDEVVSKWVGESEKNLSKLFTAARKHAPAVIFIDEVDALGRERSGQQQWGDQLLNHLLTLLDGVINSHGLYVIAATNRAELVDPALKRPGRLSKVIEIPLPDRNARLQLFALYLSKLKLGDQVQLDMLASVTEGMSGADIKEICNRAGLKAFQRESSSPQRREFTVRLDDIEGALREMQSKT